MRISAGFMGDSGNRLPADAMVRVPLMFANELDGVPRTRRS